MIKALTWWVGIKNELEVDKTNKKCSSCVKRYEHERGNKPSNNKYKGSTLISISIYYLFVCYKQESKILSHKGLPMEIFSDVKFTYVFTIFDAEA